MKNASHLPANPPTSATPVRKRLHKLLAALPHVLGHAVLGMLIAAVLGWVEAASKPVNEFNGLFWVFAVSFTGPVACALAAPLHFAFHARASTAADRHLYSVTASFASYALVWGALQVLFRR